MLHSPIIPVGVGALDNALELTVSCKNVCQEIKILGLGEKNVKIGWIRLPAQLADSVLEADYKFRISTFVFTFPDI